MVSTWKRGGDAGLGVERGIAGRLWAARTLLGWATMRSALWLCVCAGATLSCVGNIGERGDGPGGQIGDVPPELAGECGELGPSPMRRLTRWEYDNTILDVLGDDSRPGSMFVPEAQQFGFDNGAAGATLSSLVIEQFEKAANDIAERATADMPALLECDVETTGEDACVAALVERIGLRLFRRPLSAEELELYQGFFDQRRTADGFALAVKQVLSAMLQSPHFLYRLEIGLPDPAAPNVKRLTPWETASRLSYLLWGSAPDEELLEAAEAGELDDAAGIAAQVERMLDDDKGARSMKNFYAQWAQLGALASIDRPDTELDPAVGALLRTETETFIDEVLRKGDGTLGTLLSAPYTFMNAELAAFYGVDGPGGEAFEQVELDADRYAGILTQGSMMALLAHPEQPSPVLRGKFVREQLLCTPPPPPPNDVDTTLPEIDPEATAREQLEQKTGVEPCKSCHSFINPPGFAFEHFDEVGRWRDDDHGLAIDASGDLTGTDVDGPFDDHIEMLARLAESEDVRACAVLQWFRYAHGRDRSKNDACSFDQMSTLFSESGGNVRKMLVALTQTPAFLYRRTDGGAQ
jgi:hypothetical protein